MEELKIASWNALGGLQRADRAQATIDLIRKIDPDFMFFAEACDGTFNAQVESFFNDSGYEYAAFIREVGDDRSYSHNAVISRIGIGDEIQLGNRSARHLHQRGIDIVGSHFSDRDPAHRVESAQEFGGMFSSSKKLVLMGDLNDMYAGSWRARALRAANIIPLGETDPWEPGTGLKMYRTLGVLLRQMAEGHGMQALTEIGMENADPNLKNTMKFLGIRWVKLDHILTRGVEAKDHQVHRTKSDHDAISAAITV